MNPIKCSWYPFIDEPLVEGQKYAPRFSNPQIIMPNESCDGKWHMFFNSWIGLHHFISDSGIAWEPRKMVVFRGSGPFIFRDEENYCLVYEKHDLYIPIINRRSSEKNDGHSRIEMITSTDLITWSKPRLLLDSREVQYANDYLKSPRLSNPQIIKTEKGYRLYFGASLVTLPDTNYKIPRYLGYASSDELYGPYTISQDSLIYQVNGNDPCCNLAAGNIKIIKEPNAYYAFQCGFYWDDEKKKTMSALHILQSGDGLSFKRISQKPIVCTASDGWAEAYITACDAHYKQEEQCWYCYFSACGKKKKLFMYESIGLLIGNALNGNSFSSFS